MLAAEVAEVASEPRGRLSAAEIGKQVVDCTLRQLRGLAADRNSWQKRLFRASLLLAVELPRQYRLADRRARQPRDLIEQVRSSLVSPGCALRRSRGPLRSGQLPIELLVLPIDQKFLVCVIDSACGIGAGSPRSRVRRRRLLADLILHLVEECVLRVEARGDQLRHKTTKLTSQRSIRSLPGLQGRDAAHYQRSDVLRGPLRGVQPRLKKWVLSDVDPRLLQPRISKGRRPSVAGLVADAVERV